MGCDIHVFCEKRVFKYDDVEKKNGIWVSADKWTRNDYQVLYPEGGERKWEVNYKDSLYYNRNYDVFAMLADVRNGYGFAGIDTGDGFEPMFSPRGIPNDACEEIKSEVEIWDCDGHSHSYVTLQEILDYCKKAKKMFTSRRGYVSAEEYKGFIKNGFPNRWSGMVSGGKIEGVSNEQMQSYIDGELEMRDKIPYTKIEWKLSYMDSFKWFAKVVTPKMKAISENPHDVRLVFWFDN